MNNPKETFGMLDERDYAGWAYLGGQGVSANEAIGLKYLATREANSLRLAAG